MRSADRCICCPTPPKYRTLLFNSHFINGNNENKKLCWWEAIRMFVCIFCPMWINLSCTIVRVYSYITIAKSFVFFLCRMHRHLDWFVVGNVFILFSFEMLNAWPLEWKNEVNSVQCFSFKAAWLWYTFEMSWRQPNSYRICDVRHRQGAYYLLQ